MVSKAIGFGTMLDHFVNVFIGLSARSEVDGPGWQEHNITPNPGVGNFGDIGGLK
jgi:hypothetical protein